MSHRSSIDLQNRKIMRWRSVQTSQIGKRSANEDYLNRRFFYEQGQLRYSLLVACDGVGGRANGAVCSRVIGRAVVRTIRRYLQQRPPAPLAQRETRQMRRLLLRLPIGLTDVPEGATTMVLLLFDHKRARTGYNLIVGWAGDSRAQVFTSDYHLQTLTQDHHDPKGRITGYYTLDGCAHGNLVVRHIKFKELPLALSVTTDGVHSECGPEEWRKFLAYCLLENKPGCRHFGQLLERFLLHNISDNFSASLMYRRGSGSQEAFKAILLEGSSNV